MLKQYWAYNSFRPLQEEIITAILEGKDILALLPTGGGKSLCFQVPALMKDGLCLVVSPLIALMKDQVENLQKKGITAFAIYSGMSWKEVINTLKLASRSNCKFLYVSPERLETRLFLEYLPSLQVSLLAIDEAHCISQWGYDFRPPYLRIAALRDQLPNVPVLALTASATFLVQEDICTNLQFKQKNILRQSFERPRLSYSAFRVDSKMVKLVEILSNVPGSSIVYCKSRKRAKETAVLLKTYHISADFYHAGLTTEDRTRKQENWISNRIRVMVCTNAFGMGIDKPDVRVVVHVDAPDSLENYYQEAGRAGRDGKKAYAVLLYQDKDLQEIQSQVTLRFPLLAELRTVYQALVNFLQIANGTGQGIYYDFDIADFLLKFKLPAPLVVNSLKVLEHANLVSFNEQVFLPSKIVFICCKEMLYQFEASHPDLEPVIKSLLRSYEGIFDQEVNIHEKSIAFLLKMEVEEVIPCLQQLNTFNIIHYVPQKMCPQLYFIQNRVKADEMVIDWPQYIKRKKHYQARVDSFIEYIECQQCRSQFTGNYFGDNNMKTCGICDNCRLQQKVVINSTEFSSIQHMIMSALHQPVHSKNLMHFLQGIKKEKAWKVIEFLQAEKIIEVNESGMICKK
ncbi:MAG: ATP-dependent DNA helicase RecQ [Chitinophagaceae bacterium]